MKNMKKILCVVLAALMLLSVSAFAAEEETLNYVVLGDSIGWGAGVLNSNEAAFGKIVLEKLCELGLGENTEPVIRHEGIDQAEIFSFKFLVYIFRTLFARLTSMFTVVC